MRRAKLLIAMLAFGWVTIPSYAQTFGTIEALTEAAKAGDTSAKTELGLKFLAGEGTLQDYTQAARWLSEAAQSGDRKAQNEFGRLLFTGLGVEQDAATALQWLKAAADSGNAEYIFDFASALETTVEGEGLAQVADLYSRAAQAGHINATVSLGVLYQNGTGVPKDYEEARKLYEIGVAAGDARAQNNLGLLLVRGDGLEQDYAKAAELFAAAANQGQRQAMANLGVLYENGFGVPQDTKRADELYRMSGGAQIAENKLNTEFSYDARLAPPPTDQDGFELLKKSARADDPVALFQLGWLLVSQPNATFSDQVAAFESFQKGAERGHGPSMANLSLMYFKGQGAPQDFVLGHMWMLMAKRSGTSTPTLDALFAKTATPDQVNAAQQRASDMLEEQGAKISP